MRRLKVFVLVLVLACVPFCLGAAGLKESYKCGEAAEFLCISADAYSSPAPRVGDILGGFSPYAPLTRMEGCEMLLRAFGPLPDADEGVRYLIKYRDCAFGDVPEYGKTAVENLTNAGLYIPEDNSVFGPDELMTEQELKVLVDRIHAYLQSSPKDDYYSWATADLVNDPSFLDIPYDVSTFSDNMTDIVRHQAWTLNMLNDCLENPDTPEKKNIAAFLSTYVDQEMRENSMTYIQPMVDAIWNAPDYGSLINVCADICRETGIEVLLLREGWADHKENYYLDSDRHIIKGFGFDRLNQDYDPDDYLPGSYEHDADVEQISRLFSYLGFEPESSSDALTSRDYVFLYTSKIIYDSSDLPKEERLIRLDDIPVELKIFPWKEYLERAGYENNGEFYVKNYAEMAIYLSLRALSENLPGIKVDVIFNLIRSFQPVVPAKIRDAFIGYWGDLYAADPSLIFDDDDLNRFLLPLVQADVYEYYSKLEEYPVWEEYLRNLCNSIITSYRQMLSETEWLGEVTKARALEKLDAMDFELLIPQDRSRIFRVEYVSAEDGGTLFENLVRYLKALRSWVYCHGNDSVSDYNWSTWNCWINYPFYTPVSNTFFLTLSDFIASHITPQSSAENVMGYLGTGIGHEISHAFDNNGSYFNGYGEQEDWWTEEDRAKFTERALKLAKFMEGYEYFPGFSVRNGSQIINETIADLTSMKCMMRIAAEIPDFDYEEFFYAFANSYAFSSTRRGADYYLSEDVHPNGRLRVNRILSATDEFYKIFDIQPGDAMYVSPDDRPVVW